nr:odorant receptor 19 [Psyttalia incisi]
MIHSSLLLICAQLNTSKCRLSKAINDCPTGGTSISDEIISCNAIDISERNIIDCVEYHRAIFKYFAQLYDNYTNITANEFINHYKYEQHLLNVFRISEKINLLFRRIIFVQYSASTIIICFSIFMTSQVPLISTKALFLYVYLVNMMVQIFGLCVTADEATNEVIFIRLELHKTSRTI